MFKLIVKYADRVVMEACETMVGLMWMAARHSAYGALSFQVVHDD